MSAAGSTSASSSVVPNSDSRSLSMRSPFRPPTLSPLPFAHRLELRGGHLLELGAALGDGELAEVGGDAGDDVSGVAGRRSREREPGPAEDAGPDERIGVTLAPGICLAAVDAFLSPDDCDVSTRGLRGGVHGARADGDAPRERTRDRCRLHERPGACVCRDAAHWPGLRCPLPFFPKAALFTIRFPAMEFASRFGPRHK